MANPAPCQACLEVADAEFYVTNRLGVPWPFEQSTVALCVPCMINFGIQMGEALQAAISELEAMAEPEGPGVVEQIEADEKADGRRSKRARAKQTTPAGPEGDQEVPQETEASDD